MKMNIILPMLLSILVIAGVNSCRKSNSDSTKIALEQNKEQPDSTGVEGDVQFAIAAADGGLLEVQLGNLALTNGASEAVKKFGQDMINDHSSANKELSTLAQQKNITLPQTLSEKNQKHYDDFSKMTGQQFDEAYSDFMVKDHKDDIEEFRKEAEKGKDKDLQAWASGKVPVLEHHLMMAEQTHESVKKNQ